MTIFPLAGVAMAQTQLANPSFEEDAANVGNPDGWTIGKGADVKVVSENASDGKRALLVSDGYDAVFQNLQIPVLAGQKLTFSVDAKSAGAAPAVIGARIGYMTTDNKWHDVALFWNKPLATEYRTITANNILSTEAKSGRLYVAIYRSDKKSTFYIDNVKLKISKGLSDADAHHAVTLARDTQYFLNRLSAASAEQIALPRKDAWQKQAEQILAEANNADETLANKLDPYDQEITSLNAQLFAALANGKIVMAAPVPAFDRLAPDALPPLKSTFKSDLLSLRGEHQSLGIDLATNQTNAQKITVQVHGLPQSCNITWRRQVFTETWYTRGKTLVADPLTKLPQDNNGTFVEVQPGEVVRLYADIDVPQNAVAGNYPIKIELSADGKIPDTLTSNLQILPQAAPPARMTNYAFGYPTHFPIDNYTAEAVRDLTAHGVTDIEWPFLPPATFDKQGNLLKINFSDYNRRLKAFAPTSIKLNTFWQSSYDKFMTEDGTPLKVLSPEWKNALVQAMKAWIKDAEEHGVSADRITVLVKDEIHSASLESAPDASIDEYVAISELLHQEIPQLKQYLSLTYFAFVPDIQKALPEPDVIMPHMPVPTKLERNAPPTYNPRIAFEQQVYPMLFAAQKQRGLVISSYHVAAGRSDDLLQWNRFYPVLAAATGHTGIAFWAYNAYYGTTWDDTDGGLLDYSFVYNGNENNPLCQQYNVTGETIVPSIRWEAVRAGLQDANILLALKEKKLTAVQQAKLQELITQSQQWNGETDAAKKDISIEKVESLSQQLRELYAEQ